MDKLNLKCNPIFYGIMAYWDAVDDATNYIITLYVDDKPIAIRNNQREECYHSFVGLADNNYKVKVVAENRNGEIIATSYNVLCNIVGTVNYSKPNYYN